jgi:hypothetical protein
MPYTKDDLKPVAQSELTGVPLLREQWELAKAEPEGWDQGSWIKADDDLDPAVTEFILEHKVTPWNCGTTCCVAGRIALAKGAHLTGNALDYFSDTGYLNVTFVAVPGEEFSVEIDEFARNALGLSRSQACALFAEANSREDIDEMVRLLEEDPDAELGDWGDQDYDEDDDDEWL